MPGSALAPLQTEHFSLRFISNSFSVPNAASSNEILTTNSRSLPFDDLLSEDDPPKKASKISPKPPKPSKPSKLLLIPA